MKKSKLFVIMLALSLMICALPVCAASSTTEAAAGTEAAEKPDREAEGTDGRVFLQAERGPDPDRL